MYDFAAGAWSGQIHCDDFGVTDNIIKLHFTMLSGLMWDYMI